MKNSTVDAEEHKVKGNSRSTVRTKLSQLYQLNGSFLAVLSMAVVDKEIFTVHIIR